MQVMQNSTPQPVPAGNSLPSILVTGASGLLGCALVPYLRQRGHQVFTHGLRAAADFQVDLSQAEPSWAMLNACAPEVIINLAALTNVDSCERAPHEAYLLNVKSVENLTAWIKHGASPQQRACYLLQISSDQVYDATLEKAGQAGQHGPFNEEQIRLTNTYAFSKKAAELASQQVAACALRTNFFGKSQRAGRVSFSDWLANSLQAGQSIEVFEDVLFSPLSINTLVQVLANIAVQQPQGVFNLGSRGGMSKADFAFAFAQAAQLPTASMRRASSSQATQLQAYRPKDMRMDSSKLAAALDWAIPDLLAEIQLCGRDYLETAR